MASLGYRSTCSLCKTKLEIRSVGRQWIGDDTFNKKAPVMLCPRCDAPSPLPKRDEDGA